MRNIEHKEYKILLIDQDDNFVNSVSAYFKAAGYINFVHISDVQKGFYMINHEHIDILLLSDDLIVNDTAITFQRFNKNLYTILLTNNGTYLSSLKSLRDLGIQACFYKSHSFNEFIILMDSANQFIHQVNEVKIMNQKLQKTYDMLEKSYFDSIQTLRYTVEAKDTYTRGHSDRVSDYSVLIGKKMNLSSSDIKTLQIGGLFHDIGKIGVPDTILQKDGKLTDEEYAKIKTHPVLGAYILSSSALFKDILPIVRHHHERYDGHGYPKKLKGIDIPLLARIAAVADSFDSMTSKRVYREALPMDKVILEFKKNRGKQFDPHIVDVFLDILDNHYPEIRKIQLKYN